MTREEFAEFTMAVEDSGADVYERYSGRFMYGEQCVGFVGSPSVVAKVFARLGAAQDTADVAEQMAEVMRTDNMGLDMIFYFPGWSAPDEGPEPPAEPETPPCPACGSKEPDCEPGCVAVPESTPPVHLRKDQEGRIAETACNLRVPALQATGDTSAVTCGGCAAQII